jgi:hypothetical protein
MIANSNHAYFQKLLGRGLQEVMFSFQNPAYPKGDLKIRPTYLQ